MSLTIKEILNIAEGILKTSGDADWKTDAQILLSHVIGYDAKKIFMNWTKEIDDRRCNDYLEAVNERAAGRPTQYITGVQEFYGCKIRVDESVLIPRFDTETLVETALDYINNNKVSRVLDLCTGSGAIAIALAKKKPSLKITATDISEKALAKAKKNAEINGVAKSIKFQKSDLFEELKIGFGGKKYDLITSNPPYIPTAEINNLQREIKDHEPLSALDGGEDGLEYYRAIIKKAPESMTKQSALILEIGSTQAEAVNELITHTESCKVAKTIKDLSENDRVIIIEVER
jgi:release factor glutamine methyltransferase